MKAIATKNLIALIRNKKVVTERDIAKVMYNYGDEFYNDRGTTPWTRVSVNEEIKEIVGNDYIDIGDKL